MGSTDNVSIGSAQEVLDMVNDSIANLKVLSAAIEENTRLICESSARLREKRLKMAGFGPTT